MNLEERIGTAWKEYDDSSPQMKNRENFSAGYLAAMRSLFVDLDLNMSECTDYEWYWIRTDDGWQHAMRVDFGFEVVSATGDDLVFSCGQEDVRRVVDTRLPSPKEIFGEVKQWQ